MESHVVYTKIYPRYKSRKNISFARDDLSKWLRPHESSRTDVILVGHSLGGILAAEVALIPSTSNARTGDLFQHRILGLIAFDTPFLGMHPGVVGTGISSLFRTPAKLPVSPPATVEQFSEFAPEGPTYNPSYTNDVLLEDRSGTLQRFWYFWNKHTGELAKAAGDYVSSHLEFGGCLADYPGLKRRYNAVRELEDVDEIAKPRTPNGKTMRRMRFVNYYSASTGPVKERSAPLSGGGGLVEFLVPEVQYTSTRRSSGESLRPSTLASPRLSLEEDRNGTLITKDIEELNIDPDPPEVIPTSNMSEGAATSPMEAASINSSDVTENELALLPPLPPLPAAPGAFDPGWFKDEQVIKLLRKEHDRKVKAYERNVKDREDSQKDREKLLEQRRRVTLKQREKKKKEADNQESRSQKEQLKRSTTLNPEDYDRQLQAAGGDDSRGDKIQKDRKFCSLPPNDSTGKPDSKWIRVYFQGIDEVTAHTSMFMITDTYAKMVGDVVERIEGWLAEDASARMILAERDR